MTSIEDVRDLVQRYCDRSESTGGLHQSVPSALSLEVITSLDEGQTGGRRESPMTSTRTRLRVQPGPDCRATERQLRNPWQDRLEPLDAVLDGSRVSTNSCPSVTGVASIKWVRPDFTMLMNSACFERKPRRDDQGRYKISDDPRAAAR